MHAKKNGPGYPLSGTLAPLHEDADQNCVSALLGPYVKCARQSRETAACLVRIMGSDYVAKSISDVIRPFGERAIGYCGTILLQQFSLHLVPILSHSDG